MNIEDIRQKYQCDASQTFAQWKEWVRKNKPSQAQAHIVKAVAPNGSKYERLIGGYTDAQNTAFDLVSHGYKNVKLYHSVNAGPLKLLRNFSAPLHGAKFKDSDVSTDAQDDKKFFFQVFTRNGKLISKIKAPDTISTSIATRLAEQESKKFKKNWYKCQIVDQNGRSYETFYNKVPSYNGTRELAAKNMDSVDEIRQKYAKDVYSPILGKEFSGKGKDFDKALRDKRYEGLYKQIDFYLKHYAKQKKLSDVQMKDLKRLVNEIRSYGKNGERWVTEVKKTVKEFKDSCEDIENIREKYANDAAFGVKVKGNEKATERLTMEKVFKELSPAPAWKKVKKGNTIVIRTNINGKDQDVVTIKYFNPNIVAMTPKGGAANMVALKDVSVMCNKLGVEGRRSYNDSADDFASDASVATFTVKSNRNGSKYGYIEKICKTEAEAKALVDKLKKDGFVAMYRKVMYRDSSDTMDRIRAKYCMDVAGAGVVNPNFKFQTNVEKRLATTRKGRAMTLPQYGKPSKVIVKKDGNSFSVIGKDGQKLNKNTFKSYEEAEKWARGNGWMVERR